MTRYAASAPVIAFAFAGGRLLYHAPSPGHDDVRDSLQLLCLSPRQRELERLLRTLDTCPQCSFSPTSSGEAVIPLPGHKQAELLLLVLSRPYLNPETLRLIKRQAPATPLIVISDPGAELELAVEAADTAVEGNIPIDALETAEGAAQLSRLIGELRASRQPAAAPASPHNAALTQIIDTLPLLTLQLDHTGQVVYASQFFCRWIGLTIEQIRGSTLESLLGSEAYARLLPLLQRAYEGETVSGDVVLSLHGVRYVLGGILSPYFSESNALEGLFISLRDITRRQDRHEQAFRDLMEMSHMSRLINMGQVATQIAHEVNQPLTAISTTAEALKRVLESAGGVPPHVRDMLALLEEQSRRASAIVKRFRQLARKPDLSLTMLNLADLFEQVEFLATAQCRQHNIQLVIRNHARDLHVVGESLLLEQAILNLVQNAIEELEDAHEIRPEIRVEADVQPDQTVTISIVDNGPGIQGENEVDIFEPFFTTKENGLGLGLSICRAIIEKHGGTLTRKEPPRGAHFVIQLPVVENNA